LWSAVLPCLTPYCFLRPYSFLQFVFFLFAWLSVSIRSRHLASLFSFHLATFLTVSITRMSSFVTKKKRKIFFFLSLFLEVVLYKKSGSSTGPRKALLEGTKLGNILRG
jgi:hypothetical protein